MGAVLESRLRERPELLLLIGHEDRQAREPLRRHPLLEPGEDPPREPVPAGARGHGEEDDPALVVRRAGDADAEHGVAVDGDDGVVLLARGEHLRERVDGLGALGAHLVPQSEDGIHVGGLVVAQADLAHAP